MSWKVAWSLPFQWMRYQALKSWKNQSRKEKMTHQMPPLEPQHQRGCLSRWTPETPETQAQIPTPPKASPQDACASRLDAALTFSFILLTSLHWHIVILLYLPTYQHIATLWFCPPYWYRYLWNWPSYRHIATLWNCLQYWHIAITHNKLSISLSIDRTLLLSIIAELGNPLNLAMLSWL